MTAAKSMALLAAQTKPRKRMDIALKYLAAAIIFATLALAVLFRYEFVHSGTMRNDRWTGRSEVQCSGDGWMTDHECEVLRNRQRYVPIQ